jgi:hypothetical protein
LIIIKITPNPTCGATINESFLLTNKKFESCDDEILVKELTPKKPRELTEDEEEELVKTLKFSNSRLFDTFNVAKSMGWNLSNGWGQANLWEYVLGI